MIKIVYLFFIVTAIYVSLMRFVNKPKRATQDANQVEHELESGLSLFSATETEKRKLFTSIIENYSTRFEIQFNVALARIFEIKNPTSQSADVVFYNQTDLKPVLLVAINDRSSGDLNQSLEAMGKLHDETVDSNVPTIMLTPQEYYVEKAIFNEIDEFLDLQGGNVVNSIQEDSRHTKPLLSTPQANQIYSELQSRIGDCYHIQISEGNSGKTDSLIVSLYELENLHPKLVVEINQNTETENDKISPPYSDIQYLSITETKGKKIDLVVSRIIESIGEPQDFFKE